MKNEHLYPQPGEPPSTLHHYARKVANFIYWQRLSSYLFYAASKIEPDIIEYWSDPSGYTNSRISDSSHDEDQIHQLHDTYLMLVGLAIENLLKSAIVKQRSREMFDETLKTKSLPSQLMKHDLICLCKNAHIILSKDHCEFLNRLTHIILRAGRYPMPLKPESQKSSFLSFLKDGVATSSMRLYLPDDIAEVKKVIEIISREASIKNPLTEGAF